VGNYKSFLTVCSLLFLLIACRSNSKTYKTESELVPDPGRIMEEMYTMDSIRIVLDHANTQRATEPGETEILIYALPNGNSIEWTMGKQLSVGDDWHYDIQHIAAQTRWLRERTDLNFTLAYLEAPAKSWPHWNRQHADHQDLIKQLFQDLRRKVSKGQGSVTLSSHSGGGSLVNGFIEGSDSIPQMIERIVFIDSNYGYNSGIGAKLVQWIQSDTQHRLVAFAYNDSIALYEGKPFVSPTGGTWYRTKMMLRELSQVFEFERFEEHGLITFRALNNQILIVLKNNPDRGIYHTEQVAFNGFIHSRLFGTPAEGLDYEYFGVPVYREMILEKMPVYQGLSDPSRDHMGSGSP